MIDMQKITTYLSEHISDPVPLFIMQKEICPAQESSPAYENAYEQMRRSKWYRELADEQWADGSWGRFHTQDTKAPKRKFATTETALRRARELGLPKEDPVVAKCIKLMERYVTGQEAYPDPVEKHHDNGKSFLTAVPFLVAANLNMFDPGHPLLRPKREVFVKTLKTALSGGRFDEEAWETENRHYRGPCLTGWNLYPLMILRNSASMDDVLQRRYLDYIWHREGGIYYISDFPPSDLKALEDKRFYSWLSLLGYISGFSLFSEYMREKALPHLMSQVNRLIDEDVVLPEPSAFSVRYAESWRDRNDRKTDMILRIARIMVKALPRHSRPAP